MRDNLVGCVIVCVQGRPLPHIWMHYAVNGKQQRDKSHIHVVGESALADSLLVQQYSRDQINKSNLNRIHREPRWMTFMVHPQRILVRIEQKGVSKSLRSVVIWNSGECQAKCIQMISNNIQLQREAFNILSKTHFTILRPALWWIRAVDGQS